jgi:hypothetical protein
MSICARRIVDLISGVTLHAQRRLAGDVQQSNTTQSDQLKQYFKYKTNGALLVHRCFCVAVVVAVVAVVAVVQFLS